MWKLVFVVLCNFFLSIPHASAQSTTQPSVAPLVLITQEGKQYNLSTKHLFELSKQEFDATTPWTSEEHRFRGVTLYDLIKYYSKSQPNAIRLTALNDYVIEMPRKEWTDYHVLMATQLDGKPISIKDKGPITIVFARKRSVFNFLMPNINDEKTPYLVWFLKKIEMIN